MSTVHVMPLNDLGEHEESAACRCIPRVELGPGNTVVTHNSFDGREALLQAEMLLYGEYQNGGVSLEIRLEDADE